LARGDKITELTTAPLLAFLGRGQDVYFSALLWTPATVRVEQL
jgi:hypothetical protein